MASLKCCSAGFTASYTQYRWRITFEWQTALYTCVSCEINSIKTSWLECQNLNGFPWGALLVCCHPTIHWPVGMTTKFIKSADPQYVVRIHFTVKSCPSSFYQYWKRLVLWNGKGLPCKTTSNCIYGGPDHCRVIYSFTISSRKYTPLSKHPPLSLTPNFLFSLVNTP